MADMVATSQADIIVKESISRMIDEYQRKRKIRQRLYWDYYLGRHYFNITNEKGEPIYGMGKKRVKKNYCKYVVDEAVSALFADAIDIKSFSENEELKGKIEDGLKEIWCSRTGKKRLKRIGVMGGVSGDCYLKLVYDPTNLTVIPNVLDTSWVTPVFDPNDVDKLLGIIINYTTIINGKPIDYTETVTPQWIRIYSDRKMLSETPNKYGFLPIVHIKNSEIPNNYEGMSDIENIYDLNNEINYATSDKANSLYYHGNPLLALIGAGVDKVEVGPDRTLNLPDEKSKAEYIKRDTDFSATDTHINDLRKALMLIARLPEEVPTSGNISGVALAMLQAPLIKLVADKQTFYGEGIEQANELILKILEKEGVIPLVDDYRTDIVFASYLPVDEKMETEIQRSRLDYFNSLVQNGFLSKKTAMEQMAEEGLISVANIETELKAVEKEAEDIFPDEFRKGGNDQANNQDQGQDQSDQVNIRK